MVFPRGNWEGTAYDRPAFGITLWEPWTARFKGTAEDEVGGGGGPGKYTLWGGGGGGGGPPMLGGGGGSGGPPVLDGGRGGGGNWWKCGGACWYCGGGGGGSTGGTELCPKLEPRFTWLYIFPVRTLHSIKTRNKLTPKFQPSLLLTEHRRLIPWTITWAIKWINNSEKNKLQHEEKNPTKLVG